MTSHRDLIDALTAGEEHLEYEQLAAIVDAETPEPEHVKTCASCAADLADLRRTAAAIAPRRPRRAVWWAVAAGIVLAVLAFVARPRKTVVDSESAALVNEAAAGRIVVSERAAAMRRERGTLMGSAAPAFDVIAPVATLVRETKPQFSWKPLSATATYRVEIYADRSLVMQSPELHDVAWQPTQDLQRGAEYVWQVVATDGDARTIAPQPPAGEARFGLVDDATNAAVAAAQQRHANEPLVRALLEARAGLLDDARKDWALAAQKDPRSPAVKNLGVALR
ncbi:MAG: hypothetical protein JOZ54_10800 [Acidobacteria bacterium]|nr:hypothetical protein [Acidobacteriota bacterium]